MIIPVLTTLTAFASVPEPIKTVGEFLLGLIYLIGLMGRPWATSPTGPGNCP